MSVTKDDMNITQYYLVLFWLFSMSNVYGERMVATSTNCCVESLLGKRVDTRRVVSRRDKFSAFGRCSDIR
jgi:hypothetical protein